MEGKSLFKAVSMTSSSRHSKTTSIGSTLDEVLEHNGKGLFVVHVVMVVESTLKC